MSTGLVLMLTEFACVCKCRGDGLRNGASVGINSRIRVAAARDERRLRPMKSARSCST